VRRSASSASPSSCMHRVPNARTRGCRRSR
jgi:hypothetical protein